MEARGAWVAYPMREIGVRQMTPTRTSFPPSVLSQRKMVWATILGWLLLLALLLFLFAFEEVEAAEVSFTKAMTLVETDGNVQLAMFALDDQAKQTALSSNCDLAKMRRKMVVFDFTEPELPTLRITYTCLTKTIDTKGEK